MSETSDFIDDMLTIQSDLQKELKDQAVGAVLLLDMLAAEEAGIAVKALTNHCPGAASSRFNQATAYSNVRGKIVTRFKLCPEDLQVGL